MNCWLRPDSQRATLALNQMTGDIQMFDLAKFRLRRNNQTGWARALALMVLLWSTLVIGLLAWDSRQQKQSTLDIAAAAARANINKDQGFRKWASTHGGVYVPPTEHTPPNPYLKVPDRDVVTTTGKTLTLMNPAYMLRELQSDFPGDYGNRSHITSLNPINPNNAPDAWEAKALHTFEQGGKELLEAQQIDGQPYLRMMLPLIVEQGCLKCHAQQGYKLGDIRGGISTAVPLAPFLAREREFSVGQRLTHGAIWLVGLAGLVWLSVSFRRVQRLEILSRTAAAVEESERHFRAVTESASDAIITSAGAGNITGWNAAAERMFGYTKAEIIGQPLTVLMPERFRNLHSEGLARVAAGGTPHLVGKTTEVIGLRKDGSEFPHEISLAQWQAAGGQFFTAIVRDNTKRKQSEQALQESESKYRLLIENSPDIAYTFSVKRGSIYCSSQVTLLLGYSVEHLYANPFLWNESIHPEDRAAVVKAIEEFKHGAPFKIEYRIKNAHGGWRWFYDRAIGGREENGDFIIEGLAMDITERKQAEQSLRKLLLAVEQSPSSIVITDLDANIEYVNATFIKTTGYSLAEVAGQNPRILHSGKTPQATYDNLWACLARGELWKGEFINKRKDGSEYTELAQILPVRQADGSVTNYLAIKDDITERKQSENKMQEMLKIANQSRQVMLDVVEDQNLAQAALRQLNDKLEEKVAARTADLELARLDADQANQAKSAFLAAMSHEIRTPMNGVIGMIDVLQQSSLNGSQMETTNIIHDSAFALLTIIDDILDFSKIEAGKLQIDYTPMGIAGVVEGACETLIPLALKKGVELTLFTDPGIPAAVMGDPGRLRQILVNLTNNAIKFSSGQNRQGKVSLRAVLAEDSSHLTVRSDPSVELRTKGIVEGLDGSPFDTSGGSPRAVKGNCVQVTLEFRVTDNGIGMDETIQARLFTPFTQADTSTTRNFGGTGLGLVIARQLINIMGGEITLHSEPDKGSMFSVRLPFKLLPDVGRDSARHVGLKPDLQNPDLLAGLLCLVVGDSKSLADDFAAYLAYDKAVVERAADIAAAQQWIANQPRGLCIVIIDTAGANWPLGDLRAAARAQPNVDIRFVVIGRGGRRKCRAIAADHVELDAEVMHRRTFMQAVAIAAGRAEQHDQESPPGDVKATLTPLSREEARQQGRLILVAEDNEINQKVLLQQLKLLGKTADVASDGREALELWQSGDYGLLFTDLHMPKMDGYELAIAIRAAEKATAKETNQPRIPIIAITANALKGEADHCRAIGMDDYLSKPVQLVNLKAMLEKWLPTVASD
ncbi:MAG: PAS domain S-box protein, partial [Gallionella sp.]|nr:PAS domain S-box protein [Gallionella sp.]